jgi:flagellar basal-body rod modification protein FlgD
MEIEPTSTVETPAPEPRSTLDEAGLGRDAFLKIFLTQLEYQDPLSPQDASQMAAQLAQFSQLEQSLVMSEELKKIGGRLDELLELSGGGRAPLDPVSLLGRLVELEGDTLRMPVDGSATILGIRLPESAQTLGIEVQSPTGARLAAVQLDAGGTAEGMPSALRPGTYALVFENGEAQLRLPSGTSLPLEFAALTRDAEGNVSLQRDENGAPVPYGFEPGARYTFSVGGTNADGFTFEPTTTTAGTVESVRFDSEVPLVVVNGEEIDLSTLIGVR